MCGIMEIHITSFYILNKDYDLNTLFYHVILGAPGMIIYAQYKTRHWTKCRLHTIKTASNL